MEKLVKSVGAKIAHTACGVDIAERDTKAIEKRARIANECVQIIHDRYGHETVLHWFMSRQPFANPFYKTSPLLYIREAPEAALIDCPGFAEAFSADTPWSAILPKHSHVEEYGQDS